jgi:hypothetical protein
VENVAIVVIYWENEFRHYVISEATSEVDDEKIAGFGFVIGVVRAWCWP